MASKTMNLASTDRSIQSLPERINRIKKDFQMSKEALHDWVAKQNRLIDEEERQIELSEEAIDVDDDPTDKSVVCANDETAFNVLIATADKLLSEKS